MLSPSLGHDDVRESTSRLLKVLSSSKSLISLYVIVYQLDSKDCPRHLFFGQTGKHALS